jgi:hypothetical protein
MLGAVPFPDFVRNIDHPLERARILYNRGLLNSSSLMRQEEAADGDISPTL